MVVCSVVTFRQEGVVCCVVTFRQEWWFVVL